MESLLSLLPLLFVPAILLLIFLWWCISYVIDACKLKKSFEAEQEKFKQEKLQIEEKQRADRIRFKQEVEEERTKLWHEKSSLKIERKSLEKERSRIENDLKPKQKLLEKTDVFVKEKLENLESIIKEKCNYYPQLAAMMADLLTVHYEESAKFLETKPRPAFVEAERIKELRKKTRAIIEEKKIYEYQLAYLRSLFPDIDKYFDNEYAIDVNHDFEESDDNIDRVRHYISSEEYNTLSVIEKNQLALDNYLKGRKSKWQIGRDYELYIGYLYRKNGYNVEYNGILKQLEDMGRDIIATKGNETLIIQCKNWSQEKLIHEKHIFQLYGSVIYAKVENPSLNVKGVFITSTNLSETAKCIANFLGIKVKEQLPIGEFPRIKCNVNRTTGEKIYHLPFDQQYDKTKIESNGEFFALTVQEAEAKGFRRAWRYTMS